MIKESFVDIRTELNDMMKETSYEVLIQKTSSKIRCKCYNEKYREHDPKCKVCVGTGWLFKFEKQKTFKQSVSAGAGSAIVFTEVGMLTNNYCTFFFEHMAHLGVGDYIWEVAWKNDKPIKLVNLYNIESVTPVRGESGSIQFKKVIAKKEPIDNEFKNMYIGKAWRDIK